MYVYACRHVRMYVCMYVCMYVRAYEYMHVRMHVCVWTVNMQMFSVCSCLNYIIHASFRIMTGFNRPIKLFSHSYGA